MKQVLILSIFFCFLSLKGFTLNSVCKKEFSCVSSVMLVQQQTVADEAVKDSSKAEAEDGHMYGIWLFFLVLGGGIAFMVIFFITSIISYKKRVKQHHKNKAGKIN